MMQLKLLIRENLQQLKMLSLLMGLSNVQAGTVEHLVVVLLNRIKLKLKINNEEYSIKRNRKLTIYTISIYFTIKHKIRFNENVFNTCP
jgi:hypothetical protein